MMLETTGAAPMCTLITDPLTILRTITKLALSGMVPGYAMIRELMLIKLKENGLKRTPQRLAIIEALAAMGNSHPSASAVYREAKKIRKSLSLSTTYTTLSQFSAHGIIKTLQFDTTENRYEANIEEHVNLICDGCGKIIDHEVSTPADSGEVLKMTGFLVTDTRLEYYGYCEECRKKEWGNGNLPESTVSG
jgi:Fur family transcriptional regulator, peroxide stress response regulator